MEEHNHTPHTAYTQTNKPSTGAIWLMVGVFVMIGLLLLSSKKPEGVDTLTTTPTQTQTQTLCYYSSTPALSGLNDEYALKLALVNNDASGELMTVPAEKDSMKGTLKGVMTENSDELVFDGWYTNQAEGMTAVDQRLIKLTPSEARIGYGEMVQNTDGSYSYKDRNAVDYSLVIPRVDCAIYDQVVTLRS